MERGGSGSVPTPALLTDREVKNMCCGNNWGGGNCCWIIILILILFCCCGGSGNSCGCTCGCNNAVC